MTPSPRWPTDEELRLLLAGDLEVHRAAEIEALLEREEVLREQLERIAGGASWGNQVAGERSPLSVDPALQAAMARLKQPQTAATMAQDAPSGPMTLSFLAPAKNADALGNLAHYEVQEIIGAGGFGTVLKAYDPKLNRYVAIKVLSPHLAAHATARQRFLREAHAAGGVSNDHVVTIYAIEESHQPPYIVMEYVPGLSLQQLVDREGPLSVSKIVRIGAQAAEGLAAAHQKGLIHRDIKPANILLENGVQRVKLTDFGLARLVDDAALTQSGVVAGTPQYMSPEQALGQAVDYRSDLFSLGSVLYTMCTGRPAFRADSAVAVLKRVCDDQPRPVREVNPEIPAWLAAIVDKLMAKSPDHRFSSAREVRDLLERCLVHVQQPNLVALPEEASRLVHDGIEQTPLPPVLPLVTPLSADARELVLAKVRAPAIGLTVIAILNWLMSAVIGVLLMANGLHAPLWVLGMLLIIYTFVAMLVAGAALAMRRLRYWPLAVLASIVIMLIGPGSVLGIFVGIWSLIVLLQRDVREAFAAVAAGQAVPAGLANQSPSKKSGASPATPYATQSAPRAGWGLVAVLVFVGCGVMFGCAGVRLLLYWATPQTRVVPSVATPAARLSCQLTVRTDLANTQISIQGTGSVSYEKHSLATPADGVRPDFSFTHHIPAGTYYVAAWDNATRKQIFEELVTLREGEQTNVLILPQALHPKTVENLAQPAVHHSEILDVILSSDGSHVAWNVKNSTAMVFETATGKQLLRVPDCDPRAMALSADGKKLAIRTKDQAPSETVLVFDVGANTSHALRATGKFTDEPFRTPGSSQAIAFSPDGQTLELASTIAWTKQAETDPDFRSVILRWRLDDGEELPTLGPQDGQVTHLVFPATKSDLLFSASTDGQQGTTVAYWDLNDAKLAGRMETAEETLDGLAATPWGGWLYAAYDLHHNRRSIQKEVRALLTRKGGTNSERGLWQTGRVLGIGPVNAMAVSPDGKVLAIATRDRNIRLFDATNTTTTKEIGAVVASEHQYMLDLAFTPDSRELVAGTTLRTFRWDVSRWTKPQLLLEEATPLMKATPPLPEAPPALLDAPRLKPATPQEMVELVQLAADNYDRAQERYEQGVASIDERDASHAKWLEARLERAELLKEESAIRNNLASLVEVSQAQLDRALQRHQQGLISDAELVAPRERLLRWQLRWRQAQEEEEAGTKD